MHRRWHAAAIALYAAASWLFLDHGASLTGRVLGSGTDPSLMMWFLAWWPYALTHHLDPLFTTLIWQPAGLNLAWTTCVPLLALLAWPFTALGGPVLAFNVVTLAAPVLSALAAYALCWRCARSPAAALVGGYLFGFSAYEMAQANDHLNLNFLPFLPLLVLLTLRRCDGASGRAVFAVGAALCIAGEFLVSAELCAVMLIFAALAWGLAMLMLPAERPALRRLVIDGLAAGALTLMLLAPMLAAMFGRPHDLRLPPHWPTLFSTDALNLLLPTITTAPGSLQALPITRHFTGFADEQDGYLGVLLIALLGVYFVRSRHQPVARYLAALLCLIVLLSLGPQLWLGGIKTGLPLPWALFQKLPLIGNALPSRFMVFADLVVAVAISRWLGGLAAGAARRRGCLYAVLACLTLLPYPHPTTPAPYLAAFAPGRLQTRLGQTPNLLILPFGITGDSSYWQAENHFGFRQTGGYLGYPPARLQNNTPLMRLYFGLATPNLAPAFAAYCHATHTDDVLVTPGTPPAILGVLKNLDWPAQTFDDVTVFTVPRS